MRYIDKYKKHTEALEQNVRYLKSVYSRDLANPNPSPAEGERSFVSFKRHKEQWKPLLFEEQMSEGECRCCYCMRKIDETKGESGIEHVIPKTLSGREGKKQYEYYSSFAPALRDHVMMADEFAKKTFATAKEIEAEAKMPHTTGLSNLVIACNGRGLFTEKGCRCNNSRGDEKIMPIMLMPNAERDVRYDQNGILTIACNDGTLDKIIDELNSETFKEIRSVWYHLSHVDRDIATAERMSKVERAIWFKEAYETDNFAKLPEEVKRYSSVLDRTNADTYWKLLLAYDWFYYKYRDTNETH